MAIRGIALVYLYVRDVRAAARWYEDALGLRFAFHGDEWAEAALEGGQRFALHAMTRGAPQTPGTVIVDLLTDALDETRERLVARGIACGAVTSTPAGRFFELTDGEGYRVQLFEAKR